MDPKILSIRADTLERVLAVTEDDLEVFAGAVDIYDARAFAAQLQAFVRARIDATFLLAAQDPNMVAETLSPRV